MSVPKIPFKQAYPVETKYLNFDRRNPRFAPDLDADNATDEKIIDFFLTRADLAELIQSIAISGYLDIDPLIVIEERKKLVVLEGNRRLAAIKLLTDPKLAAACEIEPPKFSKSVAKSLEKINVYLVAERDDARDFIGFKHINGPHRWDSFAKARFAADWFLKVRAEGVTLKEISKRMGDRHDTIQRMVAGIFVLDQAEKEGVFHVSKRYPEKLFSFSHLYTALTRAGYRQFLGLTEIKREEDPTPNPVPTSKLKELKTLLLWLYGDKVDGIKPVVISQNPNIKQLGEVLETPRARAIMLKQNDLKLAYAEVEPPSAQFERSLVEAHQSIENAQKKVDSFDGKDGSLIDLAEEIKNKSKIVFDVMKRQRSKA